MTLQIPPGAPIDEDAIGRELKMGRTPVREAIKRLALENLVTVFPRRGTFASEINITDLAHISDVRAQLEGHAAYRAAERITDAQRAELAGLLEELRRSRGSDDLEALMELDATRASVRLPVRRAIRSSKKPSGATLNLSLRIWYLVIDRLPHLFVRVHEHQERACWRSQPGTPTERGTSSAATSRRSSRKSARSSERDPRAARTDGPIYRRRCHASMAVHHTLVIRWM